MQVIYRANVSLMFWCYTLEYVINYLNHLEKKGRNLRTTHQVLNGNSPEWSQGMLTFNVVSSDDTTTLKPLRYLKKDPRRLIAKSILDNKES